MQQSSWIRRMFEHGVELRKIHGAEKVFDLSLGNPLLEPPPEFARCLQRLAHEPQNGQHRYMPNAGFPEVRAAVAEALGRELGVAFGAAEILMSVGAAGALNAILCALLDPGDEVVIFAPYFAEYVFYVAHHGGVVREAPCRADFQPDAAALRGLLNERTRVVLINSPNNPTGVIYPDASLRELAQVVAEAERRHGSAIYIVSDEPYRRLTYDGVEVPSVHHHHPRTITASSYSKDLGLAGERIGYIAVNPADDERNLLVDALVFATRTLGFVNAPALMQRVVAELQDARVDIEQYRRKRDLLYGALRKMGYECVQPQGAFYLFPKSPLPDDRDFVALLQSMLVLTVPGVGFGAAGYFRASYSVEDRVLQGALPAFEQALLQVRS